jgi:hypothetical protein
MQSVTDSGVRSKMRQGECENDLFAIFSGLSKEIREAVCPRNFLYFPYTYLTTCFIFIYTDNRQVQ